MSSIPPVSPYVAIAQHLGDSQIFNLLEHICQLLAQI